MGIIFRISKKTVRNFSLITFTLKITAGKNLKLFVKTPLDTTNHHINVQSTVVGQILFEMKFDNKTKVNCGTVFRLIITAIFFTFFKSTKNALNILRKLWKIESKKSKKISFEFLFGNIPVLFPKNPLIWKSVCYIWCLRVCCPWPAQASIWLNLIWVNILKSHIQFSIRYNKMAATRW